MANLGKFSINTNGVWTKLSDIAEATFTAGEKYNLQINKGGVIQFCEKATTPEDDEGFTFFGNQLEPIPYLVENGVYLYIKNLTSNCTLNVAKKGV